MRRGCGSRLVLKLCGVFRLSEEECGEHAEPVGELLCRVLCGLRDFTVLQAAEHDAVEELKGGVNLRE